MCHYVQRGTGRSRRYLLCLLVKEREDGSLIVARWGTRARAQRWRQVGTAQLIATFVNTLDPSVKAVAAPAAVDPWGIQAADDERHA